VDLERNASLKHLHLYGDLSKLVQQNLQKWTFNITIAIYNQIILVKFLIQAE